ncbi:MAG: adenylosuccinate synthase (ISS), adenylosuccinate synthase [Candidatus Peregrinibacteria bacterium GW2011_GWF2_38_29]|nr:MAG: adenylosuccinate synthase (ISS), adenylosuccinate synthase [Candidatus Peregrinibacteria bacterium GW2011_GWF2_38_29]HBB03019.1 adenylosuccinate synthase [Candidatus Peregrinibacteria bacterium]
MPTTKPISTIIGMQWGDEGKGKLVDILTQKFDIIARATGGANAGHTIYRNGKKVIFHLIPSGMMHEGKICVIGNGVVIHIPTMMEEIDELKKLGINLENRFFISDRAHIVFEYHKTIDGLQEEMKGGKSVGTTKRGIGPAYADKIQRIGIRFGELQNFEEFEKRYMANLEMHKRMYGNFEHDEKKELEYLKSVLPNILPLIKNTEEYLHNELKQDKSILIEGANGTMLDIDHGTYPFVTSSNASISGISSGTGIPGSLITDVIGILKAYTTRVGSGPFPTELKDETGNYLREKGGEYGSTTGRPRRCGWFDTFVAKWTGVINGITKINLTKLDVMTGLEKVKICVGYKLNGKELSSMPFTAEDLEKVEPIYIEMDGWKEDISQAKKMDDLPENAKKYIKKLEELVEIPIKYIGTGVGAEDMIYC